MLISELPLNSPPLPVSFPRRSRIISGLSLSVLAVEVSPASGSLVTARLATEQSREICAIPGSTHHSDTHGCRQPIRDGALLVEGVRHVFEAPYDWAQTEPTGALTQPLSHPLLAPLRTMFCTNEGPAAVNGITLPDVLAAFNKLELNGRVTYEADIWVCRSN